MSAELLKWKKSLQNDISGPPKPGDGFIPPSDPHPHPQLPGWELWE